MTIFTLTRAQMADTDLIIKRALHLADAKRPSPTLLKTLTDAVNEADDIHLGNGDDYSTGTATYGAYRVDVTLDRHKGSVRIDWWKRMGAPGRE